MSSVLTEDLGPVGQRRVRAATWVSVAALLAMVAFVVYRFQSRGVLDPELWEPFTVWSNWRFLLDGLLGTIRAAFAAMALSIAVGFLMALGRLSRSAPVRWAARSYVELFRSIPLLLAIFAAFFGLPALGFDVSRYVALVVALTLYNSAVLAEIFRAGVLSLDRGQTEAAQAIGLRYWQQMRIVILPQAVRRMIPAIVAQLATATKDTSLGFVIAYTEFLRQAQSIGQPFPYPDGTTKPENELQTYIVAAIVYWVVIYLMTRLARRLEVQQRRKLGAGKIQVGGGLEDIEALGEEADESAVEADQARDEVTFNRRMGGGGF